MYPNFYPYSHQLSFRLGISRFNKKLSTQYIIQTMQTYTVTRDSITKSITPFATCLALMMSSVINAAHPVILQKTTWNNLTQQFYVDLSGKNTPSALTSTHSLRFVQQHRDHNNIAHIRMQQTYAGFIVFGGYGIIHSTHPIKNLITVQDDVRMNGVVYQDLETELGKPPSNFVNNGAIALQYFKNQYDTTVISDEIVIPLVYMDEQHKAHWAYKVSILMNHTDKIPEKPTAILDANSYQAFVSWNDIKTAHSSVQGMGFGGNSKIGEFAYGSNRPLLELTRDAEAQLCYMENKDVRVIDMKHQYVSSKRPMQFVCKQAVDNKDNVFWTGYRHDGYDRYNGAFSPSNDALYAGYVIKHMYYDWYQVKVLTTSNGSPMQLVMRVHYGKNYENAYWDGQQMFFGDGGHMMYPLVSLGIGAHEISHGFTEQQSNLEYYGQSGGINESFSDMAAQAAEFYSVGHNSWMIGYEVMKENSGYEALRYMDMPSKDGVSIDTVNDYHSELDVHYSSGVFNRLYYLIATEEGWNARKAFAVMVKANMDYWTPYSTFDDAGCGVLSATKDLGFAVSDISKALKVVGINEDVCGN